MIHVNGASCAAHKIPAPKPKAPLVPISAGFPLELVAMDILGPLQETKLGNVYVLVVGDHFTKWMEVYPIPNQQASKIAKTLVNEFSAGSHCPNSSTATKDHNLNRKLSLKFASRCK